MSQNYATNISVNRANEWYSTTGKVFVAPGGTFVVPTNASIVLHAVWSALNTASYKVFWHKVTGEGVVVDLNESGEVVETGTGFKLYENMTTGETAQADNGAVDNLGWTNENRYPNGLKGYYLLYNATTGTASDTVTKTGAATGTTVTTVARAEIVGLTGTELHLYYLPYTVKLVLDGGTYTSWTTDPSGDSYKSQEKVALPDGNNIKRTGYTFIGWSWKADGKDATADESYDAYHGRQHHGRLVKWRRALRGSRRSVRVACVRRRERYRNAVRRVEGRHA